MRRWQPLRPRPGMDDARTIDRVSDCKWGCRYKTASGSDLLRRSALGLRSRLATIMPLIGANIDVQRLPCSRHR
jgi:hypothetical protein